MYKRDFASELLEIYPGLELVDYRFFWRNDNMFKEDDVTYFVQKVNVCILPARSGSKRIKNKNIKLLMGRPIISWVIEKIKEAELVEYICFY